MPVMTEILRYFCASNPDFAAFADDMGLGLQHLPVDMSDCFVSLSETEYSDLLARFVDKFEIHTQLSLF